MSVHRLEHDRLGIEEDGTVHWCKFEPAWGNRSADGRTLVAILAYGSGRWSAPEPHPLDALLMGLTEEELVAIRDWADARLADLAP